MSQRQGPQDVDETGIVPPAVELEVLEFRAVLEEFGKEGVLWTNSPQGEQLVEVRETVGTEPSACCSSGRCWRWGALRRWRRSSAPCPSLRRSCRGLVSSRRCRRSSASGEGYATSCGYAPSRSGRCVPRSSRRAGSWHPLRCSARRYGCSTSGCGRCARRTEGQREDRREGACCRCAAARAEQRGEDGERAVVVGAGKRDVELDESGADVAEEVHERVDLGLLVWPRVKRRILRVEGEGERAKVRPRDDLIVVFETFDRRRWYAKESTKNGWRDGDSGHPEAAERCGRRPRLSIAVMVDETAYLKRLESGNCGDEFDDVADVAGSAVPELAQVREGDDRVWNADTAGHLVEGVATP